MEKSGFRECLSRDIADIYILNTCTVTARADKESRYWLGLFHRTNPNAKIVVTGCYADKNEEDISFLPGVAHIIKNKDKHLIADIINNRKESDPRHSDFESHCGFLTITDFKDHSKAFIKIQDGCENFCSYCKVPFVRGGVRSKPIDIIAQEVRSLTSKGFREIVLTGICLGAWGKDDFADAQAKKTGLKGDGLVDVLRAIDTIPGDFRIRLSSIELKYVDDELIEFMSGNRRMCRHLHIPLQSGDDYILNKMNRPYIAEDYRRITDKVRKNIKDVAITTDILIGFPGESDINFKNTVNFVKEVLPSRSHIFTFSKRKGTVAWEMGEEIHSDILKKRYHELNAACLGASYIYRKRFLNQKLGVLVESKRDKPSGLMTGYSDNYIKIILDGPDDLAKKIVPVRIASLNLMYTMGVYENL